MVSSEHHWPHYGPCGTSGAALSWEGGWTSVCCTQQFQYFIRKLCWLFTVARIAKAQLFSVSHIELQIFRPALDCRTCGKRKPRQQPGCFQNRRILQWIQMSFPKDGQLAPNFTAPPHPSLKPELVGKTICTFFCSVVKRATVLGLHYCQCKKQTWGFLQPHLNSTGVCQVL